MNSASLMLMDYLLELRERAAEKSGSTDFDRGYDMGVQSALDSLLNKAEAFGLDLDSKT